MSAVRPVIACGLMCLHAHASDLDGDGSDQLVYGIPGQNGKVVDRHGTELGSVGGPVALIGSFMDHPGEQMLSYLSNGTLQVWGGGAAGR